MHRETRVLRVRRGGRRRGGATNAGFDTRVQVRTREERGRGRGLRVALTQEEHRRGYKLRAVLTREREDRVKELFRRLSLIHI